jgi:hypothetical protein
MNMIATDCPLPKQALFKRFQTLMKVQGRAGLTVGEIVTQLGMAKLADASRNYLQVRVLCLRMHVHTFMLQGILTDWLSSAAYSSGADGRYRLTSVPHGAHTVVPW